jgi:hypothetical protein
MNNISLPSSIKNILLFVSITAIVISTYFIGVSAAKLRKQAEPSPNVEIIDTTSDIAIAPKPSDQIKKVEKPASTPEKPPVTPIVSPTEPVAKPVEQLDTYTNQYYPNLKITYPKDWKFNTSTKKSYYDGLLTRSITLSKNNHEIQINLAPLMPSGCHGDTQKGSPINNDLNEIELKDKMNNLYYYGKNSCHLNNIVNTNIDSTINNEYLNFSKDLPLQYEKSYVVYLHSTRFGVVSNGEFVYNQVDPKTLEEARQILKNSTIR